jgi:hypothetical protein
MTGAMPSEFFLSPWPETNVRGLNKLMIQTWEEAIQMADAPDDQIEGPSRIIHGLAARKVRSHET